MAAQPRVGFARVSALPEDKVIRLLRRRVQCVTGKRRYPSEASALESLMRVREERIGSGEERIPENRIYFCDRCNGWHLSSRELHPADLQEVKEKGDGETWHQYARRLEKKIAAQRSQLVSLLALGHGAGNRENRKRIPALLIALGRQSERANAERQHRIALVETLRRRHPLCWIVWRVTLGRRVSR